MRDDRGGTSRNWIGHWILAVFALVMTATLVSCQPISARHSVLIGGSTSSFFDKTGEMQIDAVIRRQGELFGERNAGATSERLTNGGGGRFWISLALPDVASLGRGGWSPPFVIAVKDPRIQHADLYVTSPNGVTKLAWDRHNGTPTDGEPFRYPVFKLDPDALNGAKVFMAVETPAMLESAVWLFDFQSFFALYNSDTIRLAILIGVMCAMLTYILVLGVFLKSAINLWLAGCTGASLIYFLCANGLRDSLLPVRFAIPSAELALTMVFLICASFTGFTARFLTFRRTAPRLVPWSNAIMIVMTACAVLAAAESLFGQDLLRRLVPYLGISVIAFILGTVFVAAIATPGRALIFLLAWSPAIVVATLRLVRLIFPGSVPDALMANTLALAFVGSLLLFTGIASIDIKQRETRLKGESLHSANRFRAFAEIGTDLFWEIDRQGEVSFITGRQVGGTDFLLGTPFLGVLDEAASRDMVRPIREAITDSLPFDNRRVRLNEGDGDLWISLSGRPIPPLDPTVVYRGAGRSVYRGLIRDVTEEVERENRRQMEQQMFALGQLAGSVAHEINNLIHPIINLTKRLRLHLRDKIDPASGRMMELIDISSKQAATVVSELLQSTRGERWKDTRRPISLAVEHSVEAIRPALPSTMRIDCFVDPCDTVTVKIGDILQITSNLLSNAVHAAQGAGTVVVKLAATEDGARLTVSDNGAGMEESVRRKAMQAFFSTKVDGEGTGVGLYIVQKIVHDYHGTITIDSSPGDGTDVTIFFPVRKDKNE